MKCTIACGVILAVLSQGVWASPLPDYRLYNLFGGILSDFQNILTSISNTTLTPAQSPLATISSSIITPAAAVQPIMNNFVDSLNTLLNVGILQTDNVQKEFNDEVVNRVKNATNRLVKTGNRINERNRHVLNNIYTKTLSDLHFGNNRTNHGIFKGATAVFRARDRVRNVFLKYLGLVVPRYETCSSKLTSLGMASASTGMKTMTTNTTNIINALNTKLDQQFNDFSANVNTTASSVTVNGADIAAKLLAEITALDAAVVDNTPEFDACLAAASELSSYVPIMISDNLAACVDTAITAANQTDVSMDAEMKTLEAEAAAVVTNICNCVANITSTSTLLARATASTCATTALKSLSSAPIQVKADAIAAKHEAALLATTTTFNQCVADINAQLPDLITYVESEIQKCTPVVVTTETATQPPVTDPVTVIP